jgi:hypothetical protein
MHEFPVPHGRVGGKRPPQTFVGVVVDCVENDVLLEPEPPSTVMQYGSPLGTRVQVGGACVVHCARAAALRHA